MRKGNLVKRKHSPQVLLIKVSVIVYLFSVYSVRTAVAPACKLDVSDQFSLCHLPLSQGFAAGLEINGHKCAKCH